MDLSNHTRLFTVTLIHSKEHFKRRSHTTWCFLCRRWMRSLTLLPNKLFCSYSTLDPTSVKHQELSVCTHICNQYNNLNRGKNLFLYTSSKMKMCINVRILISSVKLQKFWLKRKYSLVKRSLKLKREAKCFQFCNISFWLRVKLLEIASF